ncbi:hypothetical protein Tco_0326875 [Tanacetum coccineum]
MGYENLTQKLTFYKAFFSPQWKFIIHTILQCLSAKTTAWNEFSSTMASAIICLATNQKFNFSKYIFDNMVKNLEGGVKFLMFPSDEDRLKLNELLELCTKLSERVLDLENTKTSQDAEITKLKERLKKLERRNKSRTLGLKRLRKVGRTAIIESSKDEGLGDQGDTSKQGRKIDDLDVDVKVTLVDEAQGWIDEQEVEVEKVVSTAEVTIVSATPTTVDELTLAQTLIEIKAAKPKVVTTVATTTTTAVTRPKAIGVVVQEPSEFTTTTSQPSQLLYAKDKAMMEADYKLAQRLQAEEQHSQLKNKSFKEIQMLFDNTMKWVESFVPMDTEVVEGSKSQAEGSKKRTREELESDNSKKQKIDENVEAKVDDEAEMKKHMEIVPDDEVAIDAIPLATKFPIIVDWKIIKEGKMGYFQIIRADGSSRMYSSMIRMLQNINREDLETFWKLEIQKKNIKFRGGLLGLKAF